jgi:homopolymeric O-antigen transport system permease protein
MNASLTLHFVRQDLVDKHAGSALGWLWTILLPLANILIFTLVFSQIMGARLGAMGMEYLGAYSYSIYLIVGLLGWNAFSTTLTRISRVFHEKARLITKVKVPLFSLPVYIVVSESIIYLIAMFFYVAFLFLVDFRWQTTVIWLPAIFMVQQLLAYALGLLLAILSVFFRDITNIVGIVTQLWFWLTPIVYVITILPERWHNLIVLNPMYHVVKGYRDTLILGQQPDLMALAAIAGLGLAILFFAVFIGTKLEKDIRDFL